MLYSAATNAFYSRAIHGDAVPADAVEIDDDTYAALLEGQSDTRMIEAGEDGAPRLVERPVPAPQEVRAAWRGTASVTRAEFIRALRAHGVLTFDDALNAAKGAWPIAFAGALSGLPEPMAEAAQLDWALATSIARQNPLFLAVLAFHAATCGLDAAAADALGAAICGWIDPALPKTTPETGA